MTAPPPVPIPSVRGGGLRDDLAKPRPGLVRHRRWMTYLITTFSNRYFRAFRRETLELGAQRRSGKPEVSACHRLLAELAGDVSGEQGVPRRPTPPGREQCVRGRPDEEPSE